MTRGRLVRRVKRTTPVLLVMLCAVIATRLVLWARTEQAEGAQLGKAAAEVPAPTRKSTSQLIAMGDSLFHGSTLPGSCANCHGENGRGTALGPRLSRSRNTHGDGSIDAIARVIRVGVNWLPATRLPSMPSYDRVFDREQIRALAAYVRSISRNGN